MSEREKALEWFQKREKEIAMPGARRMYLLAIKALSADGDTISRQAAIDYFVTNVGFHDEDGYPIDDSDELRKIWTDYFDGIPPAQLERKKGKWIKNDNGTYSCSVCQSWIPEEQRHYARYCLHCGADMRGETDDRH